MKRVSSDDNDIFSPKGQLAKELELASSSPNEVISILEEKLSSDRISRIEAVVARRSRNTTVAMEGVRDPHNTAAIIRTADAFGIQVVHVIERNDRFLSSRKITQGTHKWIDLAFWKDVSRFAEAVQKEGKKIYVADAEADIKLYDIDPAVPAVFVFGNEHEGISDEMRAVSDFVFSIPMLGFATSLNVSVAAAITISTIRRAGEGDLTDQERKILKARFYLRAVRAGCDIVRLTMERT